MPRLTPRQKANRANRKKWKGFTPEGLEALRQSALANKPWDQSTGPKTTEGKRVSRKNAIKHGARAFLTLPDELRGSIVALQMAEQGKGPIPTLNDVCAVAQVFWSAGSIELLVRGSEILTRHQRLLRQAI